MRQNYNLPADYQTPSFPSLYDPRIEQTLEGEGVFLYAAQGISCSRLHPLS